MESKSAILNLLLIALMYGLANIPNIEACVLIDQFNKQNPPILIDQNDIFEKPIIRQSGSITDDDIETGMDILEAIKCGIPDSDLVAEHMVEFPWMALLVYFDGITKTPDCDGSLISERYVLTAAHCIRLENKTLVSVVLGEYKIMEDKDCSGNEINRKCEPVQEINVEEAIYKVYDPTSIPFTDDIGLVRLKTKAIFRSNVIPICLPITFQSKVSAKGWMFTAGWNRLENNRKSNLHFRASAPIINTKICKAIHIFTDLNEKHMCVGEENKINTNCKGDSGTPMFNTAPYGPGGKFRFVQYGIVSLYGSFCNSTLPHLYVRIEPYLPWIAGNIRH